MLPKCGTFSLIPLWYMLDMNKAFAGGQRCFFFFKSQEVSVCSTKQNRSRFRMPAFFGLGRFCRKHPCNAQWGNEMVTSQPASACLSAVTHGCLNVVRVNRLNIHIVTCLFSLFWGKVWPPTVTPTLWKSPCALSPCGVLMLWACAKSNDFHNDVIIRESF